MNRVVRVAFVLALMPVGCGDDGTPTTSTRGVPKTAGGAETKAAPAKPAPRPGAPAPTPTGGAMAEAEPEVDLGPPRPPVQLDARSFQRRRDPFRPFLPAEKLSVEAQRPKAERQVVLPDYAFEDLRLVAIVNAGRGIAPRALFVGSDGRSKAVKQGEFFSSAEVLLAAVNRDYVEIEVVDDQLASSLDLQRGERRSIYLKTD